MHQQHPLALIVVDYLQLLCAEADNREQEVATISRGLKQMATELSCHVFALSQLNDSGKLRESRAIGQDADAIWKLVKSEDPNDDTPATRKVHLDVEKQRSGPAGIRIPLLFLKDYTRFECTTHGEQP
jgi:replicative DNA helicase